MRIRRLTEPLEDRAEGMCGGFPYNTDTVSSQGCSICFWYGDDFDEEGLRQALSKARGARDIVWACASPGKPTKFWAHQDIE